MTIIRRALLLGGGAYVSFLAIVVHRHSVELLGLELPWGAAVSLLALYAAARGAEALDRRGATLFALGWVGVLLAVMSGRGGSFLLVTDLVGILYTAGAIAVLCVVLVRAIPTR